MKKMVCALGLIFAFSTSAMAAEDNAPAPTEPMIGGVSASAIALGTWAAAAIALVTNTSSSTTHH